MWYSDFGLRSNSYSVHSTEYSVLGVSHYINKTWDWIGPYRGNHPYSRRRSPKGLGDLLLPMPVPLQRQRGAGDASEGDEQQNSGNDVFRFSILRGQQQKQHGAKH